MRPQPASVPLLWLIGVAAMFLVLFVSWNLVAHHGAADEPIRGDYRNPALDDPALGVRQGALEDPFRLEGCISLAALSQPRDTDPAQCLQARASVPRAFPSAQELLVPLARYVKPHRGRSPNVFMAGKAPQFATPLVRGRHLQAGWIPEVQDAAQLTAACYTGDEAACARCVWCPRQMGQRMYEGARARAMGILIVDVHTGLVEAAASAYTLCFEGRRLGRLPDEECPVLPGDGTPRRQGLEVDNLALHGQGMPGSQVKPAIAIALLRAGLSATEKASLPSILTRSATEDLIDMVLCRERDFLPSCADTRLHEIARAAQALGWEDHVDLLARGEAAEFGRRQFAGRLMRLPAAAGVVRKVPMLDRDAMRECGKRPLKQRWRNCRGANLVDVVAELFGQGNALVTPVAVADAMLALAAAGNGEALARRAHVVNAIQEAGGSWRTIASAHATGLTRGLAAPVFTGLERTHTRGTAHAACIAAKAAAKDWDIACTEGESGGVRIASKTGTPVFSGDRMTLNAWRDNCTRTADALDTTKARGAQWHHLRNELAKCGRAPLKWYAMLVGEPGTRTWDKAVVILAERNWDRYSGMIDSVDDRGANVAAEAGLAVANALYRR